MTDLSALAIGKCLRAPLLPINRHGGLGALVSKHLCVAIAPYDDMHSGDLLQLFWNDVFVAFHIVTPTTCQRKLQIIVPERFVDSGPIRSYYRLSRPGHPTRFSLPAHAWGKLACPGNRVYGEGALDLRQENPQLAAIGLPRKLRRHGLSLSALKKDICLTIQPYSNMAVGDEITLRWGDVRIDLAPLQPSQVGQPLQPQMPIAAILENGCDERLTVSYCVFDTASNHSGWATPAALRVHCE